MTCKAAPLPVGILPEQDRLNIEWRQIKTRHFNVLWRALDGRRYFVYGWRQAFFLRRVVGEGLVRFFEALRA